MFKKTITTNFVTLKQKNLKFSVYCLIFNGILAINLGPLCAKECLNKGLCT